MKISTKGRYALRIMLDLAENDNGGYISLRDIAQRQDITPKYMEQVISTLNKAGYLHSARGSGGGYRLARAPQECGVGEILRAMEGDLVPNSCVADSPNQCPRAGECKTLPFWEGLSQVINEYVDGVTLADLLIGK